MALGASNKIQIIKYAPPPTDLPVFGKVNSKDAVFFGRTNYVAAMEEKKFIFGIKRIDRRRHIYIIGKPGVGKSKLEELMIRQDIASGYGVCVIDQHGELIENVLNFIPEERVNDVCIIDPSDVDFPYSFNPLTDIDPHFKHQLTESLIEFLRKQFGSSWTPKLEHLFRFTILALLDYPDATMVGIVKMLTDQSYRDKVIEHVEDGNIKRFWQTEFSSWAEKFDSDTIIPLVNKLGQFLFDPMLCNIFSQKENKIDFEKLMNEQKIILINLSKGKIGEDNSSFLGAIFLTKIKQAGISRAKLDPESRRDFYLYIDEFNTVATESFENVLSQSSKYGISLVLAHQYVGQLLPKIQQAVLGNVGTIILFRVGGEDATKLKSEFSPVFEVKDMINLGVGEFYIKMTIDGENYDPFSAESLRILPATHASYIERIIESSRNKFAVHVDELQKLINQ